MRISRLTLFALITAFLLQGSVPVEAQFGRGDGGPRGGGRDREGGPGGMRGPGGPGGGMPSFGGGRRGSGGPGGGGVMGLLGSESVKDTLQLSEQQVQELQQIAESAQPNREELFSRFAGLRDASPEEREAAMQQFRSEMEQTRAEAEKKVAGVLTAEQQAKLPALLIKEMGLRALQSNMVASQLKLADDQKTKLDEIFSANQPGGFGGERPSEEEREAQRKEQEQKILALLNDEQKAIVEPALASREEEGNSRDPRRRSDRDRSSSSAPTFGGPRTTARESRVVGSDEPAVSSFGAPKPKPAAEMSAGEADAQTESPAMAEPAEKSANDAETAGDSADNSADDSIADATTPSVTPVAPAEPAPAVEEAPVTLSFNFRHAPWPDVLRLFAETAGFTLDLHAVPDGTFNYYDGNEYSPSGAIDVMNGYLIPKGYLLVRRDNFLVSLKISDGIPPSLIPTVTIPQLGEHGQNEMVRVILPMEGLKADDAVKEVQPLLGPQGKAVALPASNSLLLEGLAGDLDRLAGQLADITVAPGENDRTFRSFPLEYITAIDAERHVRSLFAVEKQSSGGSDDRREAFMRMMADRMRGGGRDDDRRSSSSSSSQPESKLQLASDMRMNSLLATGTASELLLVEEIVKSIDVPGGEKAREYANSGPVLKSYRMKRIDADEVRDTIEKILPGLVVNDDRETDTIQVFATPQEHEEVQELIRQIDGMEGQLVEVLPLQRFDPVVMSELLNNLFSKEGDYAPIIYPEVSTGTLIVRGNAEQLLHVRQTLKAYGESGDVGEMSAGTPALQQGRFRRIPVQGRNAEQMARIVKELLSRSGQFENEIRIVTPDEIGQSEPEPSRPEWNETPASESRPWSRNRPAPIDDDSVMNSESAEGLFASWQADESEQSERAPGTNRRVLSFDPPPGEERNGPNDRPAPRRRPERSENGETPPQVTIEVQDGQLLIYSADEAALDQLESRLQELANQMPPQQEWSVFYLRASQATTVADKLSELMPGSTIVSSALDPPLFSGQPRTTNSLNLAGSTTATLRIIPDERTNSLFVSGPVEKVRDVQSFLKVLDATDTPNSLLDRVPRSIQVKYADAEQVAEMIRTIYEDLLPQDNNQQRRGDPRGDQNAFQPTSPVKLTIAVDDQTNELIISADDSLFREIEALVAERDLAAYAAEPTVRVVELNGGSSATIQRTLQSMTPKITITTSQTSTPTSSSSSNQDSRSSRDRDDNRSSDDQDRMRDMFRQRMREQFGGGGPPGFGRPGGGPPSFGGGRDGGGRGGDDRRRGGR